jgi:hypothetical protein
VPHTCKLIIACREAVCGNVLLAAICRLGRRNDSGWDANGSYLAAKGRSDAAASALKKADAGAVVAVANGFYTKTSGTSSLCLRKLDSNAATTRGSKSVPAPLLIVSRASNGEMALRYGRSLIKES